jgi:hypothetical protein
VLYVDAEIQRPFWKLRMEALCRKRGLTFNEVMKTGLIRPVFVRGRQVSASALRIELERLFERGKLADIGMIVLDPIYQFYDETWLENDNSDIEKLGRILLAISELTQISIMFAHHHTKGSQDGKRDIEKSSGGGSFGRFVASNLAITLLDEATMKFTLGWTCTNFPPQARQVAYREEFGWRITDEDPKTAKKANHSIDAIMACLPHDGVRSVVWLDLCKEQFPVSPDAFKTVRTAAKDGGWVEYDKKDGDKWKPTAKWLERQDASLNEEDSESV